MGRAILCEPYQPELAKTTLAIPESVRGSTQLREMRAVVIEIGPSAWPNEPPRAQPGDKVLVSKFAGVIVTGPIDGKQYRLCNDEDLFCQITADSWSELKLSDPVIEARRAVGVGGMSK